jgi:hypothetical protein
MGYYADRSNGRGTLFLVTRDEEPFCGRSNIKVTEIITLHLCLTKHYAMKTYGGVDV